MTDYKALLMGYPIYIATKKWQRRKHHKKRINKKWKKRYGYYELNMMPHGQVMMMNNVIYMTEKTYRELWKKVSE
jgi:3-deoxy-D-manno-octulosonic-acid transferase